MAADSQAFQHALLLLRTGDTDSATQWLEIAANKGHVRAMVMLGIYHAESGADRLATEWLSRAAEADDESAMNFLGAFHDDRGDIAGAVQWWGRAAQAGNNQAMFNLGELLVRAGYASDGEGWIRAAAQAGNAKAAAHLAGPAARPIVPVVPEPRPEPEPAPSRGRHADPYGTGQWERRQDWGAIPEQRPRQDWYRDDRGHHGSSPYDATPGGIVLGGSTTFTSW